VEVIRDKTDAEGVEAVGSVERRASAKLNRGFKRSVSRTHQDLGLNPSRKRISVYLVSDSDLWVYVKTITSTSYVINLIFLRVDLK
jgi:hypothetical protein